VSPSAHLGKTLYMELTGRLLAIAGGIPDLMAPLRRREIYHWRLDGSYSLKNVIETGDGRPGNLEDAGRRAL
jgi:hypothetical protein